MASAWPHCGNNWKWRGPWAWWKSVRAPAPGGVPSRLLRRSARALRYALALNDGHFQKFAELRNHLEAAYWNEAVCELTEADKAELVALIERARAKLRSKPPQVPHEEHRKLHLLIYCRLNNPFVTGILEAYWDAYEAVGLNIYAGGMDYLNEVWEYHAQMVESICNGNYDAGREVLIRHVDLLSQRPS